MPVVVTPLPADTVTLGGEAVPKRAVTVCVGEDAVPPALLARCNVAEVLRPAEVGAPERPVTILGKRREVYADPGRPLWKWLMQQPNSADGGAPFQAAWTELDGVLKFKAVAAAVRMGLPWRLAEGIVFAAHALTILRDASTCSVTHQPQRPDDGVMHPSRGLGTLARTIQQVRAVMIPFPLASTCRSTNSLKGRAHAVAADADSCTHPGTPGAQVGFSHMKDGKPNFRTP